MTIVTSLEIRISEVSKNVELGESLEEESLVLKGFKIVCDHFEKKFNQIWT